MRISDIDRYATDGQMKYEIGEACCIYIWTLWMSTSLSVPQYPFDSLKMRLTQQIIAIIALLSISSTYASPTSTGSQLDVHTREELEASWCAGFDDSGCSTYCSNHGFGKGMCQVW